MLTNAHLHSNVLSLWDLKIYIYYYWASLISELIPRTSESRVALWGNHNLYISASCFYVFGHFCLVLRSFLIILSFSIFTGLDTWYCTWTSVKSCLWPDSFQRLWDFVGLPVWKSWICGYNPHNSWKLILHQSQCKGSNNRGNAAKKGNSQHVLCVWVLIWLPMGNCVVTCFRHKHLSLKRRAWWPMSKSE